MEGWFWNKLFMKCKLRIQCNIYMVHFKDREEIYNVLNSYTLDFKAKMLLHDVFFWGDIWMVWLENNIQRKKKVLYESKEYCRLFFKIETIIVDLMFTSDGKNGNPVFCRELYTHNLIQWSVSINLDSQYQMTPFQATYIVLNIWQKPSEGRRAL